MPFRKLAAKVYFGDELRGDGLAALNAGVDVGDDEGPAVDDLAAKGPVAKISAAVRLLDNDSLLNGVAGARRAADADDSPWVKMLSLVGRVRRLFGRCCSSRLKVFTSWSVPGDSCMDRGAEAAGVL